MSIAEKTSQYLKESYLEMRNVTWPTKAEIKQHTILVVAISLATAAFLGLCDYILTVGLEQIISLIN